MMVYKITCPGWHKPLLILKIFFSGYEAEAMIGYLSDAEGFFDA